MKETEIFHVYSEVKALRDKRKWKLEAILLYDEKPCIQATGNIYSDTPPHRKDNTVLRNYDYIRHDILSLCVEIDLVKGHIILSVEERHTSKEFIE